MDTEDAVSMIVNGFCKEVIHQLPMEFAVEAQNLLGLSLEGSVGWFVAVGLLTDIAITELYFKEIEDVRN